MQYPFYVNLPGAAPVEPRTWERSLVNFKHISLIPCRCHMQYLDQLGKRNSNTIRISAMLDIVAFQFFYLEMYAYPRQDIFENTVLNI